MPRAKQLSTAAKARLNAAVEKIESKSAAEVVIAVEPTVGHLQHVAYAVGAAWAYAMLLFMLYSPLVFGLHWIALICAVAFAAGTVMTLALPRLAVRLQRATTVRHNLQKSAYAKFYELGVANTRGRTGVLVYVAASERLVCVVADVGVLRAVDNATWQQAVGVVESVQLPSLGDGGSDVLARTIEASLEPVLAEQLPRAADDIDELVNVA